MKEKIETRGGKRPGAGAPKGNKNGALPEGTQKQQMCWRINLGLVQELKRRAEQEGVSQTSVVEKMFSDYLL